MDTSSSPVKQKPKTLPKPILDLPFGGNNEVKPLERLLFPKIDSGQVSLPEGNTTEKPFQLSSKKPPLLPKPKNLKKTTFSPPFKHHKTISNTCVNSSVCTLSDANTSSVTGVSSLNIESGHEIVNANITAANSCHDHLQIKQCTDQSSYRIGVNRSDVIFHSDKLISEVIDSQNTCNELKTVASESQISNIENPKIFNAINDNIIVSQTDVERIVANTWATLQEDNMVFQKCNIKSNSHVNIPSNSSDVTNFNINRSTLIQNKTYLYSQDFSQIEKKTCESSLTKTQSLGSFGELVKTIHSVKVDECVDNDKTIIKESSNESFLHSLKIEKNEENTKNGVECINNFFVNKYDASTPKEFTPSADINSDTEIKKFDKQEEHSQRFSWSEGTESTLSRSNSIGSYEGTTSVRRRFSSWLGSFGKGNKNKETRESCLFYYDHSETDDSTVKQDEDNNVTKEIEDSEMSQNSLNNTNEVKPNQNSKSSFLKVPHYSLSNFDDDSNRSSVSEESFDVKHLPILDSENVCSTSVQPVVQNNVEKRKQKCFFIAKELVSSEKVFVDVLTLLCIDFKAFVEDAGLHQKNPVIPTNDLNKITNSLPPLLDLNKDLLRDLENRLASWVEIPKIADVIVKKGPFLRLYFTYIQNFQTQTDYLDECCQKYPMFLRAVKDFEASDRCKKLALKHYMLKPIQRIPQYRLLLEDYLEHQDEGSIDYADTQAALQIVCDVAEEANRSIKQGDNLSKLLSLQSQLGNYEIIKPGREFVMEGVLYKLSRKEMQLRFFILLSDCLLYTSHYGSMTGLRVKNKLPLCGMKVNPAHDKDSTTEFSIITSTRSFTLRAKSEDECKAWLNALQNAIKENNSRQMTFVNMNFVPMNAADEPLKLGREAPVWIPDKRVTMCQVCTAEFTVTFRRHHCRACGKVVCGLCSDYKAPLQYKVFQPYKVCEDCFEYLLKELDFSTNMHDVIKNEFNLVESSDLTNMIEQIRSSFKRSGQSSGKKVRKYIPQRLKEVTANDSGSQMSGWLYRRSRRSWKRLWFVLKEQVLYVYRASEDVVALESIPVLGYTVDMFKEGEYEEFFGDYKFVFQLTHAGQVPFVFSTDSQQSAERWISAIREATLLK